MLTYLRNLLLGAKPVETVRAMETSTAAYVGHGEDNYPSARSMKAFMDGLRFPTGSRWFFLQPGKNEVKVMTTATGAEVRDCLAAQLPDMEVRLTTTIYNAGASKYEKIRIHKDEWDLNDWSIEISRG